VDPVTDKVFLLTDGQGAPLGTVDLDGINARGDRLAYALAAVSDQPARIEEVMAALVAEVGPRETGYVAAAALGIVVQDILEPLVQIAEEVGVPIREKLAAEQV
jgi:hypothetical protein